MISCSQNDKSSVLNSSATRRTVDVGHGTSQSNEDMLHCALCVRHVPAMTNTSSLCADMTGFTCDAAYGAPAFQVSAGACGTGCDSEGGELGVGAAGVLGVDDSAAPESKTTRTYVCAHVCVRVYMSALRCTQYPRSASSVQCSRCSSRHAARAANRGQRMPQPRRACQRSARSCKPSTPALLDRRVQRFRT